MAKGDSGRIAITAGGLILSVPASYVVHRVLSAWGVLDDISDGLGKWLKIHVPPATAGWTLAVIFVLALYGLILWKVWRPRHIHHGILAGSTTPIPSLEKQFLPAAPDQWMPFHEALRHLVYESQWGAKQPTVNDAIEFDKIVAPEVRERLARGEIAARGKLGLDNDALHRATEPIPQAFWVNAFLQPHGEIAMADGDRSFASTAGGSSGPAYRAIILRQQDVERVWPAHVIKGPTSLSHAVEHVRARIETEKPLVDRLSQEARERSAYEMRKLTGGIGDPVAFGARLLDDDANLEETQNGYSDEWNWRVAKQEGRTKIERDKPLGEALAYTGLGRWGGRFSDAAAQGIGAANVPLKKFEQLAYDGRLHVWGKSEQHRDLYEEIPREHWKNNQVEWFDLLRGKPKTEPRGQTSDLPYFDLMVSRAEFEEALPYVKQPD